MRMLVLKESMIKEMHDQIKGKHDQKNARSDRDVVEARAKECELDPDVITSSHVQLKCSDLIKRIIHNNDINNNNIYKRNKRIHRIKQH